MNKISLDRIKELVPCYSPHRYAPEWEGTIVDLLQDGRVPILDRLWVALRPEFISEAALDQFTDLCGGGETPFSSAIDQIKRNIVGLDGDAAGSMIAKTQQDQLVQLLHLLGA